MRGERMRDRCFAVLFYTLMLVLVGFAAPTDGLAVQEWVKQGIVLDSGAPGDFDDIGVGDCVIIKDGVTYKMWYSGRMNTNFVRIGYATSPDGITWSKHGVSLTTGVGGEYDESWTEVQPEAVILDGSTYKMWYSGRSNGVARIGLAESADGINWTKYGEVLMPGPEEFDKYNAYGASIVKEDGVYKMWYTGNARNGTLANLWICYATSLDGVHWVKEGVVLVDGDVGEFDESYVSTPTVIKDGGIYKMWYTGLSVSWRIGYATSPDGINWVKEGLVIDLGAAGEFDSHRAYSPMVIRDGNYKMWYTGLNDNGKRIGYATYGTPATVAFTRSSATPAIGETFTIDFNINGVVNLFSTGFHLNYDPALIQFMGMAEGAFLNENGTANTSLMAELQNGTAGTLVFGASRYGTATGVTGSGTLATLTFKALATPPSGTTPLTFTNNFLEDPSGGEISAQWTGVSIGTTLAPAGGVAGAASGTAGEIGLTWDAVPGAVSYKVYRSDTGGPLDNGTWQVVANGTNANFLDPNTIPTLAYFYVIAAVDSLGNEASFSAAISQASAGLLGDVNFDNTVDGRDLSGMARRWGAVPTDAAWDWKADLNRDKLIDGEDLITLGANFGSAI